MRTDAVRGRRGDLVPAAMMRLASDEWLVEQVHGGSERAFEALFDRHHRPVLAFCRQMLGSREEAEDVVQLTFVAAYRDLVRAEPPFAVRPWLYAIARHRCLSVLRARRDDRPVQEVPEAATNDLAAEIVTREDLRAVLADVARLPDDQRAALVLAELGGVSHDAIARILACPRTKVKALVFQARSSLTAARAARETPCAEIREQLATLRGGALLRAPLRRHLRDCADCRAFREQLRTQRRALGLLLPVAPTGELRRAVLGAVFGSGGGAGGAVTMGALSAGGLAATAIVAVAIPIAGITAAVSASRYGGEAGRTIAPAAREAAPARAVPRRAGAEESHAKRDPARGGSIPHTSGGTQPGQRPSQTEANGQSRDQPEQADSTGQAEPATPAEAAKPIRPPPTTRQLAPTKPAEPPKPPEASTPAEPPRANGHVTPRGPAEPTHLATPNGELTPTGRVAPATRPESGKPAEPQRSNGQLSAGKPADSGKPAEAAKPTEPPRSNGQRSPAQPAEPTKPPQADGQPAPAKPTERAKPPAGSQARGATDGQRPAQIAAQPDKRNEPPEAAKPAEPPAANGQFAPPTPVEHAKPGQTTGSPTAAMPDGHAEMPGPTAPERARESDPYAKSQPAVATPNFSGGGRHGANGA